MKKIFRLFAAFAATTMAFSCMEEANPETGVQNGGSKYEGPMTTITFAVEELETKTSWDGENHTWSDGDQIKIVYGTEDNAFTVAEVVNGKVTATVGDVDTYYAVYPETTVYTLAVPEGGAEAQLSIVIPQTQDGSFKQANIMAAKTTKTDAMFAFKNLTHIFKFTLSEDTKYKGFQFMSNLSSKLMSAGLSSVTFNADSEEPVTVGAPATGTIGETTYTPSSVVQVGNLEPGGTYYIGLYPNVDMSYGFGFKATKSEGTTGWSEGALITTPVTTKRSEITSIPNVDKMIRNHWFFRADGTGNGSDWEHAGGVDLLVKLLGSELADGVEYNKNTNGWRLYGAELHLAAGVYELPETINFLISVNNITKIYGGYPTNLTGTSLEDRDASVNETIITKNGGSRLFTGNGSNLYNWTWDGITFTLKEGTTTTDRGGAFYFNASTKGTQKFKNCIFRDMSTTQATGGGAIDINSGDQSFNITFTDCDFINNHATAGHGGAVIIESGSKAVTKFVECDFTNNSVTGSSKCGGAIYNKASTVVVDNCSFVENSAPNGSNADGSAIYSIDSSSSDSYTGAKANLYVYNSFFKGNVAKRQGTIRVNGVGYAAIVNSTFNSNTSNNSDCDIFLRTDQSVSNAVKAYIVSCTLSDGRLYSQSCNAWCYNSIFEGYYANGTNPATKFTKSIFNVKQGTKDSLQPGLYTTENTLSDQTVDYANLFEDYSNGITPVKGIAQTSGMSSAELAALGETIKAAMPLFETKYLTVDQKGNSREGKTVMGAYVGE